MNYQRYIVVKKTTAILLMALMLFINAVKLFHTHPQVTIQVATTNKLSSHSSGDIQWRATSQNEHCAICDFKLAKDNDVVETIITLAPLSHTEVTGTPKFPVYISALQSINSGRAPPVL